MAIIKDTNCFVFLNEHQRCEESLVMNCEKDANVCSVIYFPALQTKAFSCTFCLHERNNVHGEILGEKSHQ